MEPDILRLILLIAGLALVLGIFLWDLRKRGQRRAERKQTEHWRDQLGADEDTLDIDQELQSLDQLLRKGEQAGGQQASPAVAGGGSGPPRGAVTETTTGSPSAAASGPLVVWNSRSTRRSSS